MTAGALLLWIALAAGAAAIAASRRWPTLGRALARAHAGAVLAALLVLLVAFLTSDLSYAYVWGHTRTDLPLAYKIAGLWGGEDGTILLWNAAVALFLLVLQRRAEDATHRRAALALLVFSTALTLVQIASSAFAPTDALSLASQPRGQGLAEVLQTPLMVIHPPVQFLGYALTTVPAAFAIARWTGRGEDPAWVRPAYRWARVAWLVATLGLGLGALWAYYVLSFGGYWAWDPVEVANLLPWLALTTFLHAGKHHEKFGDFPLAAPVLAALASLLTLFSTFSTRSGLWVSVHAFTDPTGSFEPDAATRLLAILAVHAPSRAFLALLTGALFAALALLLLHAARAMRSRPAAAYARGHAVLALMLAGAGALDPRATWSWLLGLAALAPELPLGLALLAAGLLALPLVVVYLEREERAGRRTLDARTVMMAAVALFGIATAVAFVVDLQVVNGPDRGVFDVRAPYVVLPIVSVLTVMLGLAPLGKRGALALAAAGAAAGLAAWGLFPGARTLALATPFLLAAGVATALKLAQVQGKPASTRLRLAGALLLLAGVLALVEGSNPLTYVGGLVVPPGLSLATGILGVALGALGVVGAIATFRARGRALAVAGAVAGILGVGYAVGALLAVAALALIVAERHRFADARLARWPEGARLRETGIYLAHLAVILGLLGYAASTYTEARETFAAVPVGSAVHLGAYDLTVGSAKEASTAEGQVDAVAVPVALARGGVPAGGGALAFQWHDTHYSPQNDVRRTLSEDVYLDPLAFHTPQGWVGATNAAEDRLAAPATVDAVTFTVSVLPLMSLVWAGLWVGVVSMSLVIGGSWLDERERREKRAPAALASDSAAEAA